MTSQAFRFIHASDFRLELPVDGLSECPERLESAILDAPRVAVERLVATALKEKVDFVVLSGDLLSPRETGPWGLLFLIEQFERLASEKIAVYWAAGKNDSPDVVPAAFRFPENVRIFPVGTVEETFFVREGVPVARLLGTSWGKAGVAPRGGVESVEGADDLYTIGVFNGQLPSEALKSDAVRYWALGGSRVRETISRSPSLAVYAGSTLARNFEETGDFGATLVEVAESGRTTATPFRTSPLRWSTETLVVKSEETEEAILAEARSRLKALQEKATEEAAFAGRSPDGDIWLVAWRVDAEEPVFQALRYGTLAQTLLRDLRTDFGKTAPIVYSVDFVPTVPENAPEELFERQTILGDYLRMLRYYLENPGEKIDVEGFFSEELRDWVACERAKRALENRRRGDDEADVAEALRVAAEAKDFRPELPTLFDLLALDSLGSTEDGEQNVDAADVERERIRASRRRKALLEASALGVDLLSENETVASIVGGLKGAPKKNRDVLAELRNLQKNIEGKESLS